MARSIDIRKRCDGRDACGGRVPHPSKRLSASTSSPPKPLSASTQPVHVSCASAVLSAHTSAHSAAVTTRIPALFSQARAWGVPAALGSSQRCAAPQRPQGRWCPDLTLAWQHLTHGTCTRIVLRNNSNRPAPCARRWSFWAAAVDLAERYARTIVPQPRCPRFSGSSWLVISWPAHRRSTGAMPMRMKWHSTDDGKRTVVGGGYLPSTPTVDGFKFTKCRTGAARNETDDSDWFANHYASGAMTLVSASLGSNLGRTGGLARDTCALCWWPRRRGSEGAEGAGGATGSGQ